MTKVKKETPTTLTLTQKKEIVAKVETLRNQGVAVIAAAKKVGVVMPTYYGYKKQIARADHAAKGQTKVTNKKTKRKYTRRNVTATALLPVDKNTNVPTVNYVERTTTKPTAYNGPLMMVIGSPDALLDFLKKMRGI